MKWDFAVAVRNQLLIIQGIIKFERHSMRSWDIRTGSLLSYKTNLIKSIIIQLNWCISQCKDYIQNSRPAKTVIFQIVGENGTNVQLFLSFSSFDKFPVWYEFVKRNVSSIYRHEVTYRMKRDGKRRKFARKNLGRDLRGYLAVVHPRKARQFEHEFRFLYKR